MRGHNEGSIYQRSTPRGPVWVASVSMASGRRTAHATSRAEAKLKLAELLRQRDSGQSRSSPLAGYLASWLEEKRSSVEPKTYRTYRPIVKDLIAGLGRRSVSDLTVEDVETYLRSLPLSPRSVNHQRAILRTALNDAIRRSLVVRNVAALARPPKVAKRKPTILNVAQAARVMTETADDRLHALWALALFTGQRQSEYLGLRWDDLDLAGGTVSIDVALARHNGEWVLKAPKSEGSRHVLPLTGRVIDALERWRPEQVAEYKELGAKKPPALVFTTTRGLPWHQAPLLREWYRTLDRLGLPRVRFHDLRHTSANLMLAAGYTLEDVKQMLGHSTIAVTSDTYAHPMADRMRQVVDGTDALVANSAERSAERRGKVGLPGVPGAPI